MQTCLAVIRLDSGLNKDGGWYAKILLKEYSTLRKKNCENAIFENLIFWGSNFRNLFFKNVFFEGCKGVLTDCV